MLKSTYLLALAVAVVSSCWGSSPVAAEDQREVVQRIDQSKISLELIENSPAMSQALAINARGHVIGMREEVDSTGTQSIGRSFFCDETTSRDMPVLEGYTNTEAYALSDNDWVVGLASRAPGNPEGSLIAVAWDASNNKLHRLPPAEGDIACHAQDISADGKRITGYSTGAEPPRLRPVLWTQSEGSTQWKVTVLPTVLEYNPYLMSARLLISPDGKLIAGCCTEFISDSGVIDSALYAWREVDGKWERKMVTAYQMHLRDMNNRGSMVGSHTLKPNRTPCLVHESGTLIDLPLLPNDVSGEAWGINEAGTVVGFSDDAPGPDGGPQAVLWNSEKVDLLRIEGAFYGTAHDINDAGQIVGLIDITTKTKDGTMLEQSLGFRTLPK